MTDEAELATLSRRLSVIEQDVEGERAVSRHMLRKLGDALVGLTKAVTELTRAVGRIESQAMLTQAELPRKLSEMVAAVTRDELAKQR